MEERSLLELFDGPALRDVLGAVPVEGGEVDEDGAFGAGFGVVLLTFQVRSFRPGDGFEVGENFEAGLVRVIHEEKGGTVVRSGGRR